MEYISMNNYGKVRKIVYIYCKYNSFQMPCRDG